MSNLGGFVSTIIERLRGTYRLRKRLDFVSTYCIIPEDYKRRNIVEYAEFYGCRTMIETGTFRGGCVDFVKERFQKIHTIEIFEPLYQKAIRKFEKYSHIECHLGDSKTVLPKILKGTSEKIIFWLDGHCSGARTGRGDLNTPIIEELDAIFQTKPIEHVVLIDDARCFGTNKDYPSIFKLKNYILNHAPQSDFEVYQDIIRVILRY